MNYTSLYHRAFENPQSKLEEEIVRPNSRIYELELSLEDASSNFRDDLKYLRSKFNNKIDDIIEGLEYDFKL